MAQPPRLGAFTLIELLVVVTIIVILIALLTPALDRAVYQAELAVCAATQRALASHTFGYAMGHRRHYPVRTILEGGSGQSQPILLFRNSNDNELPVLSSFLDINKNLQDPLVKPVDLTIRTGGADRLNESVSNGQTQLTWIYSSIAYWAGWRFTSAGGTLAGVGDTTVKDPTSPGSRLKGMRKLGDTFEWDGRRYRFIATDHDAIGQSLNNVQSKHPDDEGKMYNQALQNAANVYETGGGQGVSTTLITYSTWTMDTRDWRRGRIDMNSTYDDGAVLRDNGVEAETRDDERFDKLPVFSNALNFPGGWLNVPRADR